MNTWVLINEVLGIIIYHEMNNMFQTIAVNSIFVFQQNIMEQYF